MPSKITVGAAQTMRGLVELERQLFLSGMLTGSRSRQLQVARAALEAALDFISDLGVLRGVSEDALATDTGIARTIEAKLLK